MRGVRVEEGEDVAEGLDFGVEFQTEGEWCLCGESVYFGKDVEVGMWEGEHGAQREEEGRDVF